MTASAILAALGVAVIVAYRVLTAYRVGGLGEPTDIGGGLILLAGLGLVATGIVLLLVALLLRLIRRE